jgi:Mg/Co/Ni transporter MgtE
VEPFVGHVPTVRLRVPHPKLARLHPAEIADLVEAASHAEGEEIIEAVGADRELEADVFEELEPHHQVEFIEQRSDPEVAEVLGRMAADDAADLLAELPEQRQSAVLERLTPLQRRRVRALLGYDPATAGGLMTPEVVSIDRHATIGDARERVRASRAAAELTTVVFALNAHGEVEGWLPVAELLRQPPDSPILEHLRDGPVLAADASFEAVARLMADYNLTAAPVVDKQWRLIGVVTVDDVLQMLLPVGWRRRFGLLGEE